DNLAATGDNERYLGPELSPDRFGGQVGVLDRVVKQRGGDGLGVQLQVGEDGRHLEGVVDIVLARQAALAVVGGGGALVRLPDHDLALRIEVIGNSEKLGNCHFGVGMKFRFAI